MVLLIAAQFTGWTATALWLAALVVDYIGTALGGASGWRLPAPSHFAERHGLILIVALGESIVAIGVGVAQQPISWPIIVASGLGLLLASAMWWAYFDVSAMQVEHALATEPIQTRPRLGRNAFSFAHLPLVAGVVLTALGLKKVLEYVGDAEHHTLSDPLKGCGAGGATGRSHPLPAGARAVQVAHRSHLVVSVPDRRRVGVLPLMRSIPALGQLAILTAVVAGALIVEARIYAESRQRIRAELSHR